MASTAREYIDARKKNGMTWEEFRELKSKKKEDVNFSEDSMIEYRKQLDLERDKKLQSKGGSSGSSHKRKKDKKNESGLESSGTDSDNRQGRDRSHRDGHDRGRDRNREHNKEYEDRSDIKDREDRDLTQHSTSRTHHTTRSRSPIHDHKRRRPTSSDQGSSLHHRRERDRQISKEEGVLTPDVHSSRSSSQEHNRTDRLARNSDNSTKSPTLPIDADFKTANEHDE
ncbi:hypothetical protein BASA83_006414 [Batrachochytrium salamandrivorans]|nr:hypothetical protein BASA83_006414 [Batrachochytrium salamandrivorans]